MNFRSTVFPESMCHNIILTIDKLFLLDRLKCRIDGRIFNTGHRTPELVGRKGSANFPSALARKLTSKVNPMVNMHSSSGAAAFNSARSNIENTSHHLNTALQSAARAIRSDSQISKGSGKSFGSAFSFGDRDHQRRKVLHDIDVLRRETFDSNVVYDRLIYSVCTVSLDMLASSEASQRHAAKSDFDYMLGQLFALMSIGHDVLKLCHRIEHYVNVCTCEEPAFAFSI